MIALLLAAQMAAATPDIPAPDVTAPDDAVREHYRAERTPNVFAVPAYCQKLAQKTDRPVPPRPVPPITRRLGDLPPAYLEYAIDTRVAGCPVPTYVRYGGVPIRSR